MFWVTFQSQMYFLVHARVMDFSSRMWNTFSPYGLSTWVAMGLMLALQTLYCIWLTKVETRMSRRQHYSKMQVREGKFRELGFLRNIP